MLGVHLFGFLHHLQRHVLAARRHARRAAFAQVGHEDGEHPARSGSPFFRRRENRVRFLIRQRHLIQNLKELVLGLLREPVHDVRDLADELLYLGLLVFRHRVAHHFPSALFDFRQLLVHLLTLAGIGHVVGHGRPEHGVQVLRAVWQRRIRADRDAFHALRAVFFDIERRLAAGHILRGGITTAGRHDAERGIRVRRLVVPVIAAEHLVKIRNAGQRRPLRLPLRHRMRSAAAAFAVAFLHDRQKGLSTHRGTIDGSELADGNLAHPIEALRHDFHVGFHDAFAEPAELLDVLPVHDLAELLLIDPELVQQRRDGEERAEKRVALHAELQVRAIGGVARNLKPRQREHADVLVDDLLARPHRQPFPRLLAFLFRLPHQTPALGHAVERVGVREGLGIAAQHDGDVTQIAVHADPFGRRDHEIRGGRALLLRAVLRVRADVDDFFRIPELVDELVALVEEVVEVADDRAEVLAGRDRAPSADGVEAHRDRAFGQQRRRIGGFHFVRMIDAEHHERHAVARALPVFACACAGDELVGANRVLGPEVARPQPVHAREQSRHPIGRQLRQARVLLQRLVERRADVAAHRVVARHRFVGPLEDDDVGLAGQRLDDRRFRERTDDVEMDRADLRA